MKIKLLTLILCVLCLSSLTFGVELISTQSDNFKYYTDNELGNNFVSTILGVTNNNFSLEGDTFYYDWSFEVREISQPFFINIYNPAGNNNVTFIYRSNPIKDDIYYTETFTMIEEGTYYFLFKPENVKDKVSLYVNIENESLTTLINYVEIKPQSFNYLMSGFIESFILIVDINISLWKIIFYITLFIITLTFVISLFMGSWYIFKQSRKMKNKKNIIQGGNH